MANKQTSSIITNSQYVILKWSIQSFSLAENNLTSPVFEVSESSKWCLHLNPKVVIRGAEFYEVRLTTTANSANVLILRAELSVHGPLSSLIYNEIFEDVYDTALNDGVVFRLAKQLFPSRQSECEKSDTYVFRCEMVFSNEINSERNLHLEKLSFDLKKIYDKNTFGDVWMCAEDGSTRLVNKAVLYARSPYLAEKLDESVELITECREKDYYLNALLMFIYTGNPYLSLTSVPIELYGKLRLIAEGWQLHGLVNILNPTKILCETHLKHEYFCYSWEISNLSKMGIGTSNAVQSSEFSSHEGVRHDTTDVRWKLLLERNLKDDSSVYGIYLLKTSLESLSKNVHVEFIIKNLKTKKCVVKRATFYYGARGHQKFGFSSIVQGHYAQGEDVLQVTCKLKFLVAVEACTQLKGTATDVCPVSSCLTSLSRNFKDLLANEKFSDIKLYSGNVSIKVHKSILSARSRYFASILSKYSTERVHVPLEAEILRNIILYIYSAEVPELTLLNMQKIYEASYLLKLEELLMICRFYILNHITVENVLEIMVLAYEYGDIDMVEVAKKFVNIPENAKVIIETARWREFCSKYKDLAMDIYHDLALSYCNHSCRSFLRN